MRFPRSFIGSGIIFSRIGFALLEEAFISFTPSIESLNIVGATILVATDDFVGVHIAANSLAKDLQEITEVESEVKNVTTNSTLLANTRVKSLKSAIIVGSVNSSLIRHLSTNDVIDVSEIQGWEMFKTSVISNPMRGVEKALVIVGSDKRGTIFGIHTLAEQCGQSPYHWFADIPAQRHSAIFAESRRTIHGPPTVKYRGLFINDEEPALTTWWSARHNSTHYPLNTEFYAHVFDLLLRLKANYLWPAMWKSWTPPPGNIFFTDDPGNMQLADDHGIVISTSHHEPMQRATNEWNETETGPWDWTKNKENVTKFMDEGIRRMGANESYITLGMRGPGDSALEGSNAIEILKEVFEVERGIFKKYFGEKKVNQVWTIYKEVATYYAAGLNPPDEVTIIMPDDNHGQVQRLPTGNESEREGGVGVYFHFEYFGSPKSYKWSNSNNLPKVLKELTHAFLRNANRIWVINVGDIKPMELPFNFAMDIAWNASRFSFEMIPTYLQLYAEREFGPEHAEEIAGLLLEFSHLIGMRRFEMVHSGTYSILNYHEAETVLARWTSLADQTKALYTIMSEELKSAYYQLMFYPIVSGATYYSIAIGIGRNHQSVMERRNSANTIAQQVLVDFDYDYDLIEGFDSLLNGKWKHIMSQAKIDAVTEQPRNWANPSRDMAANLSFVQLRQNMQFSQGNMGIYAEGSTSPINQGRWAESIDASMPTEGYGAVLPVMDPYGPAVRTVDLFMRGDFRVPISWKLDAIPVDWLSIAPISGTLSQDQYDQRLNVTIDWDRVPKGTNETIEVGITSEPSPYPYFDLIRIPVRNHRVTEGFNGFPETAGLISIEAPHFQHSSPPSLSSNSTTVNGTVAFAPIYYLGTRSESGSLALRPYLSSRSSLSSSTAAYVSYSIYVFTPQPALNATIYLNAFLDTDPQLLSQFSLTLDDAPATFTRVLGDPKNAGDVPPEWMGEITNQVWTKKVSLGIVKNGQHRLVWRTNSPEVYLEKIVLDFGGVRESYLGPPETTLVGQSEIHTVRRS
ncbi:glycoside hydrolase family 115 protein [Melanomma pulvis-pyrius CBS 109.77]|uniref:Glycoside hydrolase family 115 protein n=1 Tax=Melanomma pulvis-pyrius CBS 109.77 TaxID=1314802 RepID=A0A6A6XKR0_9PLEO|nr:glycoside hydrolase family 115 protein [Melanomma pulvis-pyrius CBS 109.77]